MPNQQNFARKMLFVILFFLTGACSHTRQVAKENRAAQQAAQQKVNPSFLFLSDVHLGTQNDSTTYGDDTGMDLWENFLKKAGDVLGGSNAPGFVLYTGDLPSHTNCEPPCQLLPGSEAALANNKNLATILNGLRDLVNKYQKPLFYLPGNNDGLTGDYYSFTDKNNHTPFFLVPDAADPYPALNIKGSGKVPSILSSNAAMGYYSARVLEGLRLICLNTVMYDKKFTAVDGSNEDDDRQQQLTWLGEQLAAAQLQNEKVYIAMHVPPGIDAYKGSPMWDDKPVSWLNIFLSLTSRYKASISGIFYGHTHMDELRRLYDSTGSTVTEVAISCPGVTPQHGNNPGFKTVSYDAVSKEVMDFTTYYTTPGAGSWGSYFYSFNSVFGGAPGTTIYERLKAMPLSDISKKVAVVYNVKHGPGDPGTVQKGVEVKW